MLFYIKFIKRKGIGWWFYLLQNSLMDLVQMCYTVPHNKTSIKLKSSVYLNSRTSVWYERLIRFSHFCHPAEIWHVASTWSYLLQNSLMDLDKICYTVQHNKMSIKLKSSVYLKSRTSVWYESLIRFSHFCHPAEIWHVASTCTA